MKKMLFSFVGILFCLISNQAKSDNVIINGKTLWTIFFSPFDSYPGIIKLRNQLKDYRTTCTEDNCTFLSTWQIVNNSLVLTKIENCQCSSKKQTANLKDLFGNRVKNGTLVAYWFTGQIWVTKDQPNSWAGMFAASWPSETRLIVEKGVVISVKDFVYPKPVETVYYQNQDSLNRFVYTHINWKKIHHLPMHNIEAWFHFDQDANGYLSNIKYTEVGVRYGGTGSSPKTFDDAEIEEISRVLGLLRWPLYYRYGKPVKSFTGIFIVFNKEIQDKYTAQN